MKFNEKQIEFMRNIGIVVDFEKLSDADLVLIEEKVADRLETSGFDEDYNVTDEGKMCESILDMI
nr:MAG TPA: hypothetical protein [Caudoviricetes sp.]